MGQVLPRAGHRELSGISDDPWHDLPVAQLARGVVSGTAKLYAPGKPPREADWAYFARQCEEAWRDFGQLPGTRLRWGSAGKGLSELRTAEQQALGSRRTGWRWSPLTERGDEIFSAGGRSFTRKRTSARSSSPPGAAEFAARVARDDLGHFAKNTHTWDIWSDKWLSGWTPRRDWEFVDDTGTPIVYTCGINFGWRARAYIMFPDQRWLRFLVRGTRVANAIMTAVDQAGNRVARYRVPLSDSVQIIVHPDWELTDELALALAVSTRWLSSYFVPPEGGGG